MSKPLRLFVEETPRKVFVSALDWPGLARGAKTEDLAVESLVAHLPRYAKVARKAGERFDPHDFDIEVVSRTEGDAGSAYGIPSIVASEDREPVDAREAKRIAALVEASWDVFDGIAAKAPESLRKGPRGGGRDRSKIVEHVTGADGGYARSMGIKGDPETAEGLAAVRAAVLEVLRATSDGSPIADRKWPPRYAARRVAWHALDHAWEIEDRTERD
jgi:hypothetical protein